MSEEEVPRRTRRHRRVVVPATNAAPEDAPDFSEPHLDPEDSEKSSDLAAEIGAEDWWRAQRPPHWG